HLHDVAPRCATAGHLGIDRKRKLDAPEPLDLHPATVVAGVVHVHDTRSIGHGRDRSSHQVRRETRPTPTQPQTENHGPRLHPRPKVAPTIARGRDAPRPIPTPRREPSIDAIPGPRPALLRTRKPVH